MLLLVEKKSREVEAEAGGNGQASATVLGALVAMMAVAGAVDALLPSLTRAMGAAADCNVKIVAVPSELLEISPAADTSWCERWRWTGEFPPPPASSSSRSLAAEETAPESTSDDAGGRSSSADA